jgi:bifunctional DNase/RNase
VSDSDQETFIARLVLSNGRDTREIPVEAANAVTFATLSGAPIYVESRLFDATACNQP